MAYCHQVPVLVRLSVSADQVLTNAQLLQRVWNPEKTGGSGPVRNIAKRLRQELGTMPTTPPTPSSSRVTAIGWKLFEYIEHSSFPPFSNGSHNPSCRCGVFPSIIPTG